MTITVAADVRCDWCGISIAAMHPSAERVALHRFDAALDTLLARVDQDRGGWQNGHHIGGPPGCPLHLCRTCHNRGTPPKRLPPPVKRTRKARRPAPPREHRH